MCEGAIQFLICGHSVTAVYIFCLGLLVMALKGKITSWNYDSGIAIHTYLFFTVPAYLQLPYTYRCTPPTSYCLHHTLTVHLDSPCCSELLAFPAHAVRAVMKSGIACDWLTMYSHSSKSSVITVTLYYM